MQLVEMRLADIADAVESGHAFLRALLGSTHEIASQRCCAIVMQVDRSSHVVKGVPCNNTVPDDIWHVLGIALHDLVEAGCCSPGALSNSRNVTAQSCAPVNNRAQIYAFHHSYNERVQVPQQHLGVHSDLALSSMIFGTPTAAFHYLGAKHCNNGTCGTAPKTKPRAEVTLSGQEDAERYADHGASGEKSCGKSAAVDGFHALNHAAHRAWAQGGVA